MDEKNHCHIQLRIPSATQAIAARTYSTRTFNRILANWASDLLQRSQVEKVVGLLPVQEHGQRMAA